MVTNAGRYECVYCVNGKVRYTWFDTLQEVKNAIGQAADYDWLNVRSRDGLDDIVQCDYQNTTWIRKDYRQALRKASSKVRGKLIPASYAIAMGLVLPSVEHAMPLQWGFHRVRVVCRNALYT